MHLNQPPRYGPDSVLADVTSAALSSALVCLDLIL